MIRKFLAAMALAIVPTIHALSPAYAQPTITQPASLPQQIPNSRDASQIDISSGAATPVRATHLLGAESGTADDLTTITATSFATGAGGHFIIASGDTITVKTSGNITIAGGATEVEASAGDILSWRRNEAGTGVVVAKVGSGGGFANGAGVYAADDQAGADDKAKIQAAIDAAEIAGGTVYLTPAKTYSLSSCTTQCLLINSSGVTIEGNGATLATTGTSAAFDTLVVQGVDNVAATTLAADSARGDLEITLTSATGFAVGDLIRIDQTKTVTIAFGRTYYAKIAALAGAVVTLEAPLPFEVGASTGTNSVTKVTPVENVVIRNLTFDKSAQVVSSGNIRGALFVSNAAYSLFENLDFVGDDNHFNLQSFWGYRNRYLNLHSLNGGGGTTSDADIQIGRESFTDISGVQSESSDGFGFTTHRSAYMSINDVVVNETVARGIKMEGVVASTGGNWRQADSGTTGIMLARGTSYNAFSDIVAINNGEGGTAGDAYGLWLDNDDNLLNTLTNLVLLNNEDRDLFVHTTSQNNQFVNVRVTSISSVLSNEAGSTLFSNINGLSTFYSDDSASAGPLERVLRYSASPAANDELGGRIFQGFDSGGSSTNYCYYLTKIIDPTDTSEDGEFRVRCALAGVDTLIGQLRGDGSIFGNATGGAQGAGTINAKGFYVDGVALTSGDDMTVGTAGSDSPRYYKRAGNIFEWGHTSADDYLAALGSKVGTGDAFVSFASSAGTTSNTYKTYGRKGMVLEANSVGDLTFGALTTAEADNQTASARLAIDNDNGIAINGTIPITTGAGAPSGTCTTGGLYLRTDGGTNTTLYVCESTAWAAK